MRGYRVLFRGAAHVPRGFGLSRWRLRHISDGTILAFEFHMRKTDAILNLPRAAEQPDRAAQPAGEIQDPAHVPA